MNDGTTAYLSSSKRYYIRQEGYPDDVSGKRIEYYTLRGRYIHLARAKCLDCGEEIWSRRCGDFQRCRCGASYVDTDRRVPERHRYGGACISNNQQP